MKVLLLSRYGRKGASTRLRFLQFLPRLAAAGIEVATDPLLDDEYLRGLYSGRGRSAVRVGAVYLRRLARLLTAGRYDLLWIEKELFPRLPATFERIMGRLGCRYVVDYDDAVFHDYDLHANAVVRWALARKIDRVMMSSCLVVAGNRYLAARARSAGAPRVEIIPTVVDLDRYTTAIPTRHEGFRIGWIGSPSASDYLARIHEPLQALCSDETTRLVLVGLSGNPVANVAADVRPWAEASEVAEIRQFDVGIMPLPDEPWAKGKCGYKLIQYMACGIPVVASPVGVNAEIVEHGINGFLAGNDAEWQAALETLRGDPSLRESMGRAGRRLVERRYSLSMAAPRLLELLRQAARP